MSGASSRVLVVGLVLIMAWVVLGCSGGRDRALEAETAATDQDAGAVDGNEAADEAATEAQGGTAGASGASSAGDGPPAGTDEATTGAVDGSTPMSEPVASSGQDPDRETVDPAAGESISTAELTELEEALDDIDQLLADIELDLRQD